MKTYRVQINYKSGQSVAITCKNFKVAFSPLGGVSRVTWDAANPTPLFVGVDEIESIWELL